jgi:hypothetical protein
MQEGGSWIADDDADNRWMSYAELAESRRITAASAIKLVLRRGWRRQQDNQGIMRALVPQKWAEPAPGRDFDPLARETIDALEASIAALHERAEAAEQAAQVERDRANRAELARRAEYSRADLLRERIDFLRADLADAQAALEAARYEAWEAEQRAESLRQADARWRELSRLERIRQAWRNGPLTEATGED